MRKDDPYQGATDLAKHYDWRSAQKFNERMDRDDRIIAFTFVSVISTLILLMYLLS